MSDSKYSLVGIDGNAFAIMGYVIKCMQREKCTKEQIDAYKKDAMSSDYDYLVYVSFGQIEALNDAVEDEF